MILIISIPDDPHTHLVAGTLQKRGTDVALLDPGAILAGWKVSLRQDGPRWTGTISGIDISKVRAVWFRRMRPPELPASMAAADQAFALGEGLHVVDALWRILEDRTWVSTPEATSKASSKPYASMIAARAGFDVPVTLLTNQPESLKPFHDEHKDGIVFKTLSQHTRTKDGKRQGILTTKIGEKDLARAGSIAKSPCCFQQLIPKRADLRVIAIGDKLFACAIDSQGRDSAKVDYRADAESLPHRQVTLPVPIEEKCRRVMRDLGLAFGCIDLIETPDGAYHFLEVNPAGNWYWIEQQTGMPLLDTLVELLSR